MENDYQPRPSQTYSGGIFSRKITKTNHPALIFNEIQFTRLHYKNILECF